jgi:hypothetical protein
MLSFRYIESNGRMAGDQLIGIYYEGISCGAIKVLSKHLSGGTKENSDKSHSGELVSRQRFEPVPSWNSNQKRDRFEHLRSVIAKP